MDSRRAALAGIHVLDFSTLLPGPLASLMLAEAGAEVTKVERVGTGDEMRSYTPQLAGESANFCLLNRGKSSLEIDLKRPDSVERLQPYLARADILIEQFRPGVMTRLGLGYEQLREKYPRLIYCSITGFGQTGPRAQFAGHDLNYMAISGVLSLARGADGTPPLPHAPIADIAGGSYPAVMNVLLALIERGRTGLGCHLDISMTENLLTLAYWALAQGHATGQWPQPGAGLVTGASPRYQVYACADGGYLAAAPIEERFWNRFCELLDLEAGLRQPDADAAAVTAAVAAIIARQPGAYWQQLFETEDVCCCMVSSLEAAVQDPHFRSRGLFAHHVRSGDASMPALPLPVAQRFCTPEVERAAPGLGCAAPERSANGAR